MSPQIYGYGILLLLLAGAILYLLAEWRGHKDERLDEKADAAKSHAQDLRAKMDDAVKAGDDAAVQSALEAELLRSKQEAGK